MIKSEKIFFLCILSYPIFWAVGGAPLWGVVVFVYTFLYFKVRSRLVLVLVVFGVIQICSLIYAVNGTWFQIDRTLSILRNILIYFLFVSVVSFSYRIYPLFAGNVFKRFIVFNVVISVAMFLLWLNGFELTYNGFFHSVRLVRDGYIQGITFPRLTYLTYYPNGTSILFLFSFFIVYLTYLDREGENSFGLLLFYILTLVGCFLSGSRIVLFVLVLFPIVHFYQLKVGRLLLYYLGFVVLAVISLNVIEWFINARQGSSETRLYIYSTSFSYMIENSPLLGLGFKPILEHFPYPLGSHSTMFGYIIKNGLLGALFVSLTLILLLYKLAVTFFKNLKLFKTWVIVFLSVSVLAFEDLDAVEINAVLFGLILGFALHSSKKTNDRVINALSIDSITAND